MRCREWSSAKSGCSCRPPFATDVPLRYCAQHSENCRCVRGTVNELTPAIEMLPLEGAHSARLDRTSFSLLSAAVQRAHCYLLCGHEQHCLSRDSTDAVCT